MRKTKKFSKREIFLLLVVIILLITLIALIIHKGDITNIFNRETDNSSNTEDKLYTSFYSGKTNISLPQEFNEEALLEVHFIDVGQGDSILIRLPDNKDIFIDAGSGTLASAQRRNSFNNYLLDMSINQLEYLIITHSHSDHMNMADILIDNYDISVIMFHDIIQSSNTYRNFTDLAYLQEDSQIIAVSEEWEYYSFDNNHLNYKFDIYAPGTEFSNDANSQSILCFLEYYDTKVLFTGDATMETEEYFISLFEEGEDIDVLKVAHHGSSTSTSEEFLEFFTPEYAVISVAENNSYNHPSPFTMNRLFNQGVVTYRTNRHGNIVLYMDDGNNLGFLCQNPLPPENNSLQIDEKMIIIENN